MSNANNSNTANRPPSYTVVFTVNLTRVSSTSFPSANENQTAGTIAATRSTWIPAGPFAGCQTRQVKHGDSITAYDEEAYYLKNNYVRSTSNPYGVLDVVSETA